MSSDNEPKAPEGRPWKIVGEFDNYTQADLLRCKLFEQGTSKVKVKRLRGSGKDVFTVRVRNPESSANKAGRTRRKKSK